MVVAVMMMMGVGVGEYVAGWGREDAGMMRGWAGGDVMWWCGGGVEAW